MSSASPGSSEENVRSIAPLSSSALERAGAAGMEPAPFWARFVAWALDLLIVSFSFSALFLGVTLLALWSLGGETPQGANVAGFAFALAEALVLSFGFYLVWYLIYHALGSRGSTRTIGKRAMGLRIVNSDGSPLDIFSALARAFGHFLSALPFFAGFALALLDHRSRALHDILLGTIVTRKKD